MQEKNSVVDLKQNQAFHCRTATLCCRYYSIAGSVASVNWVK